MTLILASGSATRLSMLQSAGLSVVPQPVRLDESTLRHSLVAEGATARDIADTLAEMKARKASDRHPDALVLGCDQTLELGNEVFGKPDSVEAARAQLMELRGQTHRLFSAAVLYDNQRPVWRHVGAVSLTMRNVSDDYLAGYLARNWPDLADTVGGYKIESEGIRLFSRIDGDHFSILGLPLSDRKAIPA
jgi:septum formation protein